MDFFSNFSAFFKNGGPFMFVILGVGVVVLGVVLERIWVISRASSLNSGKLVNDLVQMVSRGEMHNAIGTAQKMKSPVAVVASNVLSAQSASEDRLQNAAENAATVVLPPLSRRLSFLSVLANTATLLGLLGTIFGLTTAFSAVGAADPSQRSAFLAAGISQALNTTSFGLIVAIPTMLVHSFLVGRVESIVEQVEEASVRLIEVIVRRNVA